MREETMLKVRQQFAQQVIIKDKTMVDSLFAGRNLPSFVKDYVLKRFVRFDGSVDQQQLGDFLDRVLPRANVKDQLGRGYEMTVLARFVIYIDLVKGLRRFAIPDMGIKQNEGQIPEYVYKQHPGELVDGEKWGVVKLAVLPDEVGTRNHVEMVDYKPFKGYNAVDMDYLREARAAFSTAEWMDVLISAMEYEADGFDGLTQKLEFLTRLLIFVEPRLNVIELAPKGTGKSFVFGNLSKYGWLISGGRVTRAKLFYDKTRQQNGIIHSHDFVAMDEIQTIVMQEPAEIQAALKSYLESGKTTIDSNEFTSECGLMIMGNIPLRDDRTPLNQRYFDSLPTNFRESALLDRFHCFIEGWHLPRINESVIYRGWTLNAEYFSEVLHTLRTANVYSLLFDQLVGHDKDADTRDFKAVKRVCVAYMKLLFPHWTCVDDVDREEFEMLCLNPAIRRRGIIKEQCQLIDPEFKAAMPSFWLR